MNERETMTESNRLTAIAYLKLHGVPMDESNRLTRYAAIAYAEAHGVTLCKYADPVEGARDDVSIEEARAIAREDAGLLYVDLVSYRR